MNANRWKTVERVFNKSVNLPPEKREKYVLSACNGDSALLEDVLTLLAEAEKSDSFLSEPIFEVGAQILASEYIGLFDEPNFSKYEVQKILGRGGSGVVFLAKDTTLERNVALKVLPTALADDDERILRFQQEAKAASAISHPNVAHIYGFGKADGRYYLAMEYVEGNTLRGLLKKKEIDKIHALDIACQMTKALSAAHKAGIVHRDIKPENVIVTDDGLVKVLDFGLAKPFLAQNEEANRGIGDSLDTKPGMIIGTTAYMSPEQIRGQTLDSRTDIWSLGVVLYEMLAGRRPFTGDTASDVQARILLSEPDYPFEIEEIPKIKKMLVKSLAKDVNLRYRSITELARDLEIINKELNGTTKNNINYSSSIKNSPSNGISPNNKVPTEIKYKFVEDEISETIEKSEKFYITYKFLIGGIIFLIVIIVLVGLFY
ncbi:MAG: serine/threonine protein kinase [Pyrinomonadaceae bacterium]|nr:serine/threonine protein kinase [Pyrinomonadaceae bacterium]